MGVSVLERVVQRFKLPTKWRPGPGRSINCNGYVRFTRKPYCFKYEHRVVVDQAIKEWNYYGWEGIPDGFEVHHIDGYPMHNCRSNLLLIDAVLHHAFSGGDWRCPYTGRYLTREAYERRMGITRDEVPF